MNRRRDAVRLDDVASAVPDAVRMRLPETGEAVNDIPLELRDRHRGGRVDETGLSSEGSARIRRRQCRMAP